MRQRIQTLDGLRFLAAMGVLWIHTWTIHGNPRFVIGSIDFTNFLAIGGNGVDLFLVISGFCMYYFYTSKSDFSYHDFYRFIKKRWFRLSPAFYVATIIYTVVGNYFYNYNLNFFMSVFHSIFYLNHILTQYNSASHFWTLTVEWQFYFIIPFLLIYQNKIGFNKTFILIFGTIILAAITSVFIVKDQMDQLTDTLLFRGIEFGCGVLAARLLIKNNSYFINRKLWLVAFIAITYTGRVMVSKSVLMLSHDYYNLFRLFGFILLAAGFAGILYLSVTSVKWLDMLLGNKFFKTMGRISYSFYLLHALIFPVIAIFTIRHLPFFTGIMAPAATTCISAIILYPLSQLSYNLLEKPFLSIGNLTSK